MQLLLADYGPRNFAVRFWDGSTWEAQNGQPPKFTLALQHAGAVRRMFTRPVQLTLAEAYFFNDFDIEGDIEAFWDLLHYLMGLRQRASLMQLLKLRWHLGRLPSGTKQASFQAATLEGEAHSPERNRQAISYHYDISNEFYALFLDERMLYSCAYFKTPASDVHQCQLDKIDHICKKMRLKPGDRLLDVGCGWGGLVVHAAQKYGATVLGITLSQRQKEWADRCIAKAGLADRCKIEIRDYREIPASEQFDKISAVGCMEHVGEVMLPAYFQQAFTLLKPGGVFLNHGIARGGLAPHPATQLRGQVRLPRWPVGADQHDAARSRASRLRGSRRREPARPLHSHAPLLGEPARSQRRRGAQAHQRRGLSHLAALHVGFRVWLQGRALQPVSIAAVEADAGAECAAAHATGLVFMNDRGGRFALRNGHRSQF